MSWLAKDYDFYCSGGYVYVYSSKGNPAKLFKDIEICPTEHIVKIQSDSGIQNWRSMYGDRDYGTNIMGGGTNFSENFVYTNYIFEHAKTLMMTVGGRTVNDVPKFVGNTFAMYYNINRAFEYREEKHYFYRHGRDIFKTVIGDTTANVIFY